jgi:hypothetical protein
MGENVLFDYYEINAFDIWFVERDKYFQTKEKRTAIEELKLKYEDLIVDYIVKAKFDSKNHKINPIVTIEEYYDDPKKSLWTKCYNNLTKTNSFEEKIALGYFYTCSNGIEAFVSFDKSILISSKDNEFDFWFTFKLGQYSDGLKYISDFLNYQFETNFESKISLFQTFLTNVLLQNKYEILSSNVIKCTTDWLNEKKGLSDVNITLTNSKITKIQPNFVSFYSRKIKEFRNKNYASYDQKLDEIYKFMFRASLIKNEDKKSLSDLFTKETLGKNSPIKWIGSAYELKIFTKLIAESNISEAIKTRSADKWEVVKLCFHIKLNGREFGAIEKTDSISGAKKTKNFDEEKIKELVAKIVQISDFEDQNSN